MSEMVERVAEAIYIADSGKGWDQQNSWLHEMYFKKARAAIEAMREPTEAMKCDGDVRPWDWSCQTCGGPKEHWYRMIDEALK